MDFREYECELIKVVDGDTIDAYIDLGFTLKTDASTIIFDAFLPFDFTTCNSIIIF